MSSEISKSEQEQIIKTINGLPPFMWLVKCKTSDQFYHWEECLNTFQNLCSELKAYFSGQDSSVNYGSPKTQKVFELTSKRYIDLYGLIRDCWSHLKEACSILKIPFPETPGMFLSRIIEMECEAQFNKCQSYFEYRPRKLHDLYRLDRQVRMLRAKKDKLTIKEQSKIQKFDREVESLKKQDQNSFWAYWLVLDVARANQQDESIQVSLRRYEARCEELDQILHSFIHPSQKQRGYSFVKGIKQSLS